MFQFKRNYRETDPENGRAQNGPKADLKKVKRVFIGIVLAMLALVLANSCWFTIQEEQQAVVCTFGQPKAVTEPGLHFKIPFIQTVTKVNTTIQGLSVGYDEEENYTDDAAVYAEFTGRTLSLCQQLVEKTSAISSDDPEIAELHKIYQDGAKLLLDSVTSTISAIDNQDQTWNDNQEKCLDEFNKQGNLFKQRYQGLAEERGVSLG